MTQTATDALSNSNSWKGGGGGDASAARTVFAEFLTFTMGEQFYAVDKSPNAGQATRQE